MLLSDSSSGWDSWFAMAMDEGMPHKVSLGHLLSLSSIAPLSDQIFSRGSQPHTELPGATVCFSNHLKRVRTITKNNQLNLPKWYNRGQLVVQLPISQKICCALVVIIDKVSLETSYRLVCEVSPACACSITPFLEGYASVMKEKIKCSGSFIYSDILVSCSWR